MSPGTVLLKNYTRSSKNEPIVIPVELLDSANPQTAHVRYPSGKQGIVSVGDLAPLPISSTVHEDARPDVTNQTMTP